MSIKHYHILYQILFLYYKIINNNRSTSYILPQSGTPKDQTRPNLHQLRSSWTWHSPSVEIIYALFAPKFIRVVFIQRLLSTSQPWILNSTFIPLPKLQMSGHTEYHFHFPIAAIHTLPRFHVSTILQCHHTNSWNESHSWFSITKFNNTLLVDMKCGTTRPLMGRRNEMHWFSYLPSSCRSCDGRALPSQMKIPCCSVWRIIGWRSWYFYLIVPVQPMILLYY